LLPVVAIRFWQGSGWTGMAVPETSVDEDHSPARGKRQVGTSRQGFRVEAIPKTHSVDETPNRHLWPCVF
jgi:hypothetical protein